MKNIRTYGKHKKREIRINLYDKWDDISDEDKSKRNCTTFLFDQTSGWTKLPNSSKWAKLEIKEKDQISYQPCDGNSKDNESEFIAKSLKECISSTPCVANIDHIAKDNLGEGEFVEKSLKEYVSSTPCVANNGHISKDIHEISSLLQSTERAEKLKESRCENKEIDNQLIDFSNLQNYESPILFPDYEKSSCYHPGILESTSKLQEDSMDDSDDFCDMPLAMRCRKGKNRILRSIDFGPGTPCNSSRVSFLEAITPFRPGDEHSINNFESRILEESLHLTAKERILDLCEQDRVLNIREYFTKRLLDTMRKIGEGSYGEVFEATDSNGRKTAMKIVPVEGEVEMNGGKQSTFTEILPEIAISKELSSLSEEDENGNQAFGFVNIHRAVCCQGAYPDELIKEWDKWDEEHGSENDTPDWLEEDQIFIIFEFEFAGEALEDYPLHSAAEAKSLLHQVSASLAVGEKALKFEHRDLHWGNILVLKTKEELYNYQVEGSLVTIPTSGIQVKMIDFTLSRLEHDGCVVYSNLCDEQSLFDGKGDYQFDIYRKMREENGNSWEHFCPKSNVLWLHYLTDKLIKKLKRRSKKLESVFKRMLTYKSACELLEDEYFIY